MDICMKPALELPFRSGQLAGWNSYTPTEKLALKVISLAVRDYQLGKESEDYFESWGFEFWCTHLQVNPDSIRERLGLPLRPNVERIAAENQLTTILREVE